MAIMNMLLRIGYFMTVFFIETSYWNVIFLCWPASMSCSLGLCQVMNYIVLYIRLDSYVQHRARKGSEISEQELEKVTKKEMIVNFVFTILIVAYPAGIAIFLGLFIQDFETDVIEVWENFEVFYMISFCMIAVMLAVSTLLSLSHMRRVFTKESMKEEGAIKCMLLLFCGTYMIRVAFAVLFHIKYEWVYTLFYDYNNYFGLAVVCLWITWDAVPLVSMLVTHYKNFSSFKDHKFEDSTKAEFEGGYNLLESCYSLDPNADGV